MNKFKKKKILTAIGVLFAVLICVFATVTIKKAVDSYNSETWNHAVFVGKHGGHITANSKSFTAYGDLHSNGSIEISSDSIKIDGDAYAVSSVSANISSEKIHENAKSVKFPNIFDRLYDGAAEYAVSANKSEKFSANSLVLDEMLDSSQSLDINVGADIRNGTEADAGIDVKIGAFGASFFAKTGTDPDKWSKALPILYKNENTESASFSEQGKNSNFLPIAETKADSEWKDYAKLPRAVISECFTEEGLTEYISSLKSVYPADKICSQNSVTVQSNDTVNPDSAVNAHNLIVRGGNFSLDGDYVELEEIRFETYGGGQLIGCYPKLRYIYVNSQSDLNLAGDFPSLETVYTEDGQILLGTGNTGFKATGASFINENGTIAICTAKDISIRNCELVSGQKILFRGAGADKTGSVFDLENTLAAARYGILFEDMNDSNTRRFGKLPVFYSYYPMSFVNCNFRILQGAFINGSEAFVMANMNDDLFRGYLFAPRGIDEIRNTAPGSFNINTYGYNISPEVNETAGQTNGTEKIGRISSFEYAGFPRSLVDRISDSEKFLSGLSGKSGLSIAETDKVPGELTLGRFIFADGDINISADSITSREDEVTVIASKNGNISITSDWADIAAVVYAPNGNITINGGTYSIKGRLFAQNAEINAEAFEIDAGEGDIPALSFTKNHSRKNVPKHASKDKGDKNEASSENEAEDSMNAAEGNTDSKKDNDTGNSVKDDSSDNTENVSRSDSTISSDNSYSDENTNTGSNDNAGAENNNSREQGNAGMIGGNSSDSSKVSGGQGNSNESSADSSSENNRSNNGTKDNLSTDSSSYSNESRDDSSSASSGKGGSSSANDSQSDDPSSHGAHEDTSSIDSDDSGFREPKYEYDLLNRLIKVTYDKDNYIEYTYDANGNIIKIVTIKDGVIQ